MHTFRTRRRIEFVDTDMGGIVHFSRYPVFMETAEHEMLESFGASVEMEYEGRRVGWPRVSVQVDYKGPARFGDVIDIEVRVLRKGERSMTYGFLISCDGRPLAEGRMVSVCCVLEAGQPLQAIPIPPQIADQLEEVPSG